MGIRILCISRKKITVQSSPNRAQSVGASCSHSSSLRSRNTCQLWSQRYCNVQPQTKILSSSVTACFQLQLLHHKILCVIVGFSLVLVHSSSYTEVLQKGTTSAAHQRKQMSRHAVPPLSRRASPWCPPWTWEHSLEISIPPLKRRGTSRGTMSEQRNPKRQDAWKCFPGHLGKNPLFNCNVLPHTAGFVFHCNATLVALYDPEGREQLSLLSTSRLQHVK